MNQYTPEVSPLEIPFGYCHCGCGQKTTISKKTRVGRKSIKGQPYKFLHGHARCFASLADALWDKVDKRGPNECWPWIAKIRPDGYGRLNFQGRRILAHRAAWIVTNGEIPDSMNVCHNCPNGDNRACCNPDHLWLGTYLDNNRDCITKGRHFSPKGEEVGGHIFTTKEVETIRGLHYLGVSFREIRRIYKKGTKSTVRSIINRKNWKHLP